MASSWSSARARWILAEDEPDIVGYDQDRWVDGLHHRDDDPEDAHRAVRGTAGGEPPTLGGHARRMPGSGSASTASAGPESYDLMRRLSAGHDRFHVAQAERALAAVRRS